MVLKVSTYRSVLLRGVERVFPGKPLLVTAAKLHSVRGTAMAQESLNLNVSPLIINGLAHKVIGTKRSFY